MQQYIDIIRRMIRRDMLKAEFQSTAHKIHNERPLGIAIAIPTHDDDLGADRGKLVENRFCADVSEMPDFVRIFGHLLHLFRQMIVRVGQDKNAQRFF